MEFTRRKWKDKDKSTHRRWMDKSNNYVITWTNQYGYKHFHAMVKCEWRGEEKLHFADRMGPYKTFNKAVEGCERNRKLWDAFIKLSHESGRRDGKFAELKVRAPYVFMFIPKWVVPEADGHFVRMMFPCAGSLNDRSSDIEASESGSSSDVEAPCPTKVSRRAKTSGPASNATDEEKSDTKKTETVSKDTSSPPGTPVPTATEVVAGSKRKSKKSIAKSSESSETDSPPGKSKKPTAKPRSKNSRRKK